jgi:type I restriction enzyme S subunit
MSNQTSGTQPVRDVSAGCQTEMTAQGVVPSGYKKTEVGMIPEDWSVKRVADLAVVKTGPFGSALHERDYVDDGTPIVTVEHLSDYGLVHENLPMVSDSDRRRLSVYELRVGDIVFSRVGSVDRNSLVGPSENGWLFSGRLLRVRTTNKNVSPKYLSYHFHSEPFKGRVREVAVGQTMASLNTKILNGILAVIPGSIGEQNAIATALSDADALIESLDRLIAKKRAIKQAAMQQLLTGKTRLPGFSGEWRTKRIGDICFIRVGTSKARHITPGGRFLIVDMGSVSRDGRLIASKPTNYNGDYLTQGELVMPKDDIGGGGIIGKVAYIDSDCRYVLGDHVYALTVHDGDSRFLSYKINSHSVNADLRTKVSGSAQLGLARNAVLQQKVSIPSLREQTAISKVLSGIDAEVGALEQRLKKVRHIKQGMMQQLLTGRVRLV